MLSPFWISRYAVTNAQFSAFVEATGHRTEAELFGWSFVFAGLLPDDLPPTRAVAGPPWWRQGYVGTAPVGAFEPNGYGLHQMTGNVWQWTADWFDPAYYRASPRENPHGPEAGAARIMRGGSYRRHAPYCNRYRVDARSSNTPDSSTANLGFPRRPHLRRAITETSGDCGRAVAGNFAGGRVRPLAAVRSSVSGDASGECARHGAHMRTFRATRRRNLEQHSAGHGSPRRAIAGQRPRLARRAPPPGAPHQLCRRVT